MTTASAGGALRLEPRDDGVALLVIDVPGASVNTLRGEFAAELAALLDEIERRDDVRAVVITSGKPDGFVAGADLRLLQSLAQAEQAAELCRSGQRVLGRVAGMRVPVVAAIHGACLGGGLELALACRSRIASDDARTKLGLPEVQLGLLPGLGGTQRLPRLVGIGASLDLLLTGKQLDARRAERKGLVDAVVPRAILIQVAVERALALVESDRRRSSAFARVMGRLRDGTRRESLIDNPLGRKLVFDAARRRLLARTRHNYPAPERILEVVKSGLEHGLERGLELEARAFGELLMTPQAGQLIGVFFATEELKKDPGVLGSEPARELRRIGVIGAGTMGSGIAYVTSHVAQIPVRLRDKDHAGVAAGLRAIRAILDERVERRRITRVERDLTLARVTQTTDYSGFQQTDLVIEAVFEDLDLKHAVLRDVEASGHPAQIFASNTSALPIAEIARAARHPERVIGMHYFSPVHRLPLLEVVVTPQTAPWVVRTAVELGKRQGKTVIVVNDGVGFFTTRSLSPYLSEAAQLLAEGVAVERIDQALVDWGFPVGPLALLDEIGIDVGHEVSEILHAAFGARHEPPECMARLRDDARLGRKNRRGFYDYEHEPRRVDPTVYGTLGVEPRSDLSSEQIAERCVLALINEAAACFGDGVLGSARDGDVGAIFGFGFPPFRGGPFRYIDAIGATDVVRRLDHYRALHGRRFAPAAVLSAMAASGERFYATEQTSEGAPRRALEDALDGL